MEENATTHGVYKRLNTGRETAASGEIAASRLSVEPNNIESVETTLSFAMNPVISAIKIPMTILRKYSPTMTSAPCPGKNAAVTGPKVLNNYCHGVILSRNTVQD